MSLGLCQQARELRFRVAEHSASWLKSFQCASESQDRWTATKLALPRIPLSWEQGHSAQARLAATPRV